MKSTVNLIRTKKVIMKTKAKSVTFIYMTIGCFKANPNLKLGSFTFLP
jgi:hypothetical protein